MGQKLSSKLLFISSPNTDGFYTFYISQSSVATGMFGNHFTTNISQNSPVKKVWKSVYIWQRYGQNFVAYFFGATLYTLQGEKPHGSYRIWPLILSRHKLTELNWTEYISQTCSHRLDSWV